MSLGGGSSGPENPIRKHRYLGYLVFGVLCLVLGFVVWYLGIEYLEVAPVDQEASRSSPGIWGYFTRCLVFALVLIYSVGYLGNVYLEGTEALLYFVSGVL